MTTAVAMMADKAATPPVIQMIDVDHFYEGQLGWNHALDHLTLTIVAADLRDELPRPRDRHSAEFLAVKSRIMQEMQRHGVASE
jgi:hypothetical protein